MSSFLFKHAHIAGKQHWLADEKCHQEYRGRIQREIREQLQF